MAINEVKMSGQSPVNWIQVIVNFFSIIVPVAVGLIVWGSNINQRITRLEERSVTYVGNEAMAALIKDVEWIRMVQVQVLESAEGRDSKIDRILQAVNDHMATDK